MMNLIIPMAGSAERFGGTFKPFLRIEGELFVEAMMRPFLPHMESFRKLVFVVRSDHDDLFQVRRLLAEMYADFEPTIVLLESATTGPVQTVRAAVERIGISGNAIICDCDHSLDVKPVIEAMNFGGRVDAVVPVWPISPQDAPSWSVAEVDSQSRVLRLTEKAWPESLLGRPFGVIGCYGVSSIERVTGDNSLNFSSVLGAIISNGGFVRAVEPRFAEFFGDPQRLHRAELMRRARTDLEEECD